MMLFFSGNDFVPESLGLWPPAPPIAERPQASWLGAVAPRLTWLIVNPFGLSELQLEPDKRGIRVRYRIDGVLHETMQMPKYIQMPLTARYKIMSEMNIAEHMLEVGMASHYHLVEFRTPSLELTEDSPSDRTHSILGRIYSVDGLGSNIRSRAENSKMRR